MDRAELTVRLKARARELGFERVGVAPAGPVAAADRFRAWLALGYHGEMAYLSRRVEERLDPRRYFPGCRSVVVAAMNYYHPHPMPVDPAYGKISRYAWGDDYHDVLRERLTALLLWLQTQAPSAAGKVCVDTAPVLEKYWAVQAGIGWLGKHTNVITPKLGSWLFLGVLLLDIELTYDTPMPDFCGRCTRCLEACPTGAFPAPYVLDARRCLSYLTIEYRGKSLAGKVLGRHENWIFGCDVCQEVCPWNVKFQRPAAEPRFAPRAENLETPLTELARLSSEAFRRRFRKSPVRRAKWRGFLRNVRYVLGKGDGG